MLGTQDTRQISNGLVTVGVDSQGGKLDPIRFDLEGLSVEPLHRAPWLGEKGHDLMPVLANLKGDFFCAPFGDSDVLDEARAHGLTANGTWNLKGRAPLSLTYELAGSVMGARVSKEVSLRDSSPLIYQRHTLSGGSGALPVGHHAMLRADEPLNLSFSDWWWGGTPPAPVETAQTGGRSALAYPQSFETLGQVMTQDGSPVDLSTFPVLEDSEEILMLVSRDAPLAWSAACAPRAGWLWFALKDPRVLQSTVLWLSNGGRDYAPFSSRHRRTIGIEEVTAYFHLGHRASLDAQERVPYRTTVRLGVEGDLVVPYAFGVVAVPDGFERLTKTIRADDTLTLRGVNATVVVPFDGGFFSP